MSALLPTVVNGTLTFSNGKKIKDPKTFLTSGTRAMEIMEKVFGHPMPTKDDMSQFMDSFTDWLQTFAETIPHLEDLNSTSTCIMFSNTMISLALTVPSSLPQSAPCSMSLDSILMRPTLRGQGWGERIFNILLKVWVLDHGFAFDVPMAVDVTAHIFFKILKSHRETLECTVHHLGEADGLYISNDTGSFQQLCIRPTKDSLRKRGPDRGWIQGRQHKEVGAWALSLAKAEMTLFCHSPSTVTPHAYQLYVFRRLDPTGVLMAPQDCCQTLMSYQGFESFLALFPWFLTHAWCEKEDLHHAKLLLMHPDDEHFFASFRQHIVSPWTQAAPALPHRALCVLLAFLLTMRPKSIHLSETKSVAAAFFVWDKLFDQMSPQHKLALPVIGSLLFDHSS